MLDLGSMSQLNTIYFPPEIFRMLCSDADTRKHAGGGNSIGFLQQQSPQGGRSHQQQVMDRQGAEDGVQGLVVR